MKKLFSILSVLFLSITAGYTQISEKAFTDYSNDARPRVWWHWLNGNISKEGITHDLEEMKKIGIGGAYIFEVTDNIPEGPVRMFTPKWYDLLYFAMSESNRLGLVLGMHNCPGWSASGGPWITSELSMKKLVWSESFLNGGDNINQKIGMPDKEEGYYKDIALIAFPTLPNDGTENGYRIDNWKIKAGFVRDNRKPDDTAHIQKAIKENIIFRNKIINLSSMMNSDGILKCNLPSGKWTILRFGYTSTGKKNAPATKEGSGLECDKFSKTAVAFHFNSYMQDLIKRAGTLAPKTFKNIDIDSYEAGESNWTALFDKEFAERRGYDLLTFLPVMTGRVVESTEISERFLWDIRRTIGDLFADNYYGVMAEMIKKNGMTFNSETYGTQMADFIEIGGKADIPMCEFWNKEKNTHYSVKMMTSAGNVYGKNIVEAESFTDAAKEGVWIYPYQLKEQGDEMYARGVNRFVFHSFPHQMNTIAKPGMTMGPHGIFMGWSNPWWEQGSVWIDYLSRCQSMLQQGKTVSDILYFVGEDVPLKIDDTKIKNLPGYRADYCDANILLNKTRVINGRIVLESGTSYDLLILPDNEGMSLPVLEKISAFVKQGAWVVGKKPFYYPGLKGYPENDTKVQQLANELWDNCDGLNVKEHSVGKGKIIYGKSALDVLHELKLKPDFTYTTNGKEFILNYLHKKVDNKDFYFLANHSSVKEVVNCTFRVTGKIPELWYPDTKEMKVLSAYKSKDGCTQIDIPFDESSSVFVVFRKPQESNNTNIIDVSLNGSPISNSVMQDNLFLPANISTSVNGKTQLEAFKSGVYQLKTATGQSLEFKIDGVDQPLKVTGAWTVSFDEKMRAPKSIVFNELMSWTQSEVEGIKYYSGAANYTKVVEVSQSTLSLDKNIYLDLGEVANVATVKINGKQIGILWKPPYRLDVKKSLKAGKNTLEVIVSNSWVNRLIGDEQYPSDYEYVKILKATFGGSLGITNIPSWFQNGEPKPGSERILFSTWRHFSEDSPLQEAGLLGPVQLVTSKIIFIPNN
ncbi:MAG: glycosyl hydrolase [Bacteroidia bacterium]|nr:glycosyl hydrolase [Bacteroidia bacterium]